MFSKRLRKASYNGVSFEITSSTFNFGRRTVTHEYPQRDVPYTEDLGRAKRKFTVSGFIVGEDYIAKTQKLILAIEQSKYDSNGKVTPGKLIHPWLDKVLVYPIETPTVTWNAEKRISTFTITFIEAGENLYPAENADSWGNKLRALADKLVDDALELFNLTIEDIEDYDSLVTSIANGSYQDILGCLSDSSFVKMFDLSDSVSNLATTAATALKAGPKEFVNSLTNALGVGGYANSITNWREANRAVHKLLTSSEIKVDLSLTVQDTSSKISYSDSETQKEKISTAIKDTVRLTMLSQYIGTLSMVGSALDADTSDDEDSAGIVRSEDEILDIRNNALDIIENEMIYQGTDEGNLYDTLADMYQCTYRYLTNEVLQDHQVEFVTPNEATPALVFAYDQYGDSSKIEDVIRRNNIHFPLFADVKTYKIVKDV